MNLAQYIAGLAAEAVEEAGMNETAVSAKTITAMMNSLGLSRFDMTFSFE